MSSQDLIIKDKSGNYYKDVGGKRTPIDKPIIISRTRNGKKEQIAPEPNKKRVVRVENNSPELLAKPQPDIETLQPQQQPAQPLSIPPGVTSRLQLVSIQERLKIQSMQEKNKIGGDYTPSSPTPYQETSTEFNTTDTELKRNPLYNNQTVLTLAKEPSASTKFLYNLETGQRSSNEGVQLGAGLALVGYGAGEFGVGVLKDFSAIDYATGKLRIPLTDTVKAITNPIQTGAQFAEFAAINPERAAGQLIGIYALGKVLGRAVKGPPEYTVDVATGKLRILETSEGGQVLIETTTRNYKGAGTPKPQSFYANVKGIVTQSSQYVAIKKFVQDTIKVDPKKNTVKIVDRKIIKQETKIIINSADVNIKKLFADSPDLIEYDAAGLYDPSTNSVHIKSSAAPDVFFHELGHALQKKLPGEPFVKFSEYAKLEKANKVLPKKAIQKYYPADKRLLELEAEQIQAYIRDPEGFFKLAPRTAARYHADLGIISTEFKTPTVKLEPKAGTVTTKVKVSPYERAIIEDALVDIYEYPKPGEGLFKVSTEQGLKIYQEPVSGHTRTITKQVFEKEIETQPVDNTLSFREGEIIKRPAKEPTGLKNSGVSGSTRPNQLIYFGEYPELGQWLNIKVKGKIISFAEKPISTIKQAGVIAIRTVASGGLAQPETVKTSKVERPIINTKFDSSSVPMGTAVYLVKDFETPQAPASERVNFNQGGILEGTQTPPRVISIPELEPKINTIISPPIIGVVEKVKPKSKSRSASLLDNPQAPPIEETIIDVGQEEAQQQAPIIDTQPITQPSSRYVPPKIINKPTRPTFKLPKINMDNKRGGSGFGVFVKRGGVFQRERGVFNKQDAIGFGSFTVANSPSATFRIQKIDSNPNRFFGGSSRIKDFYAKGDLFIEKKEKRIDTIGELRGITFKSLMFKKRRRKK